MPAPTFVYADVGALLENTSLTYDSAGDISMDVGDVVVACGVTSNPSETISFSGGTLQWSRIVTSATNARVSIWVGHAIEDPFFGVVTMTRSGNSTGGHCASFYVLSDHSGHGDSEITANIGGTPSVTMTTTARSAIVAISVDTSVNGTGATWLTNAGTFTSTNDNFGTSIDVHAGYHEDAGPAGNYSVGQSGPGPQIYDFAAIEIKGTPDPSAAATVAWWRA